MFLLVWLAKLSLLNQELLSVCVCVKAVVQDIAFLVTESHFAHVCKHATCVFIINI